MKNIHVSWFILIVAICGTGCTSKSGKDRPDERVRVETELVRYDKAGANYYTGTVEASVSIPLSFLMTGQVGKVLVSEGQRVGRGELLAMIDPGSYQSALDLALAKEQQAEDAHRRLSELYRKGSLPEIKFIEVETGLNQARASVEIARKNLADCKLLAPAAGVIGKRQIEPGSNVVPYNTVFTLLDIDRVRISFPVPEKEIATTHIGQEAVVEVPALKGAIFRGRIFERGVIANPVTHTYTVGIEIPNPGGKLMPGMVCRVWTGSTDTTSLVIIPLQAIRTDGSGRTYVYTADQGDRPVRRDITTGRICGKGVTVTGLEPGERLIVAGHQYLNENSTLEILK